MLKSGDFNTTKWIYKRLRKHRIKMLILILANVIAGALGSVMAIICKNIIDTAIGQNINGVILFALCLLGIILIQFGLKLFCDNLQEYIRARVCQNFQSDLLYKIEKKKYPNLSKYHSGVLMTHLFSDVGIISSNVAGLLPTFVNVVTRLVTSLTLLFYFDTFLGTISLIAGVCGLSSIILIRKKIKILHKDVQKQSGKLRSIMQEIVTKLLLIKIFRAEDTMHQEAEKYQESFFKSQMKRRGYTITVNNSLGLIFKFGYLLLIIWGAVGLFNGTLTYGTLTAAIQLSSQIQDPFNTLSGFAPAFAETTASAERIIALENLENDDFTQGIPSNLYDNLKCIECSNISFRYDASIHSNDNVFSNAHVTINKGDFIGITGTSGGGKSTLFYLMLGIYEPLTGEVRFCENKGNSYAPCDMARSLFSYVPQGNCLFTGTIKQNIAFFSEAIDEEKVIRSAKSACALDFINQLPNGFDTLLGENGVGISVGQAQRVAIARAIYSEAPIMLLDEATSALDVKTEKQLLENISHLHNKTCLIVTHRLEVLAICDRTIKITADGKIQEQQL